MPKENEMLIKVFYSYAQEDNSLRCALEKQLESLEQLGLIKSWSNQNVIAGEEYNNKVKENLNSADIILLLVSPDFISSENCNLETAKALERHKTKEASVIPIILRPANWEDTRFGHLQPLPKDATPITAWNDKDKAFLSITLEIKFIAKKLLADKYVKAAEHLLEISEEEKALKYCNIAIKENDTLNVAFFMKGKILNQRKAYKEAISAFQQAIEIDPKIAEYHANKAQAFFALNMHEEASDCYQQAINIQPNNINFHLNRATSLYILERHEEAIIEYQIAIMIGPNDAIYHANKARSLYALKNYKDAIIGYQTAIRLDPANANYHANKAQAFCKIEKYREAVYEYREASDLDPTNIEYYANKAQALYKNGDYIDVIEAYNAAIKIDPTNAEYYIGKAQALSALWNYTEAARTYQEAIHLNPKNSSYYSFLIRTLSVIGDNPEIAIAYQKAIELQPNSAYLYENQAKILETWAQQARDKAKEIRAKSGTYKNNK